MRLADFEAMVRRLCSEVPGHFFEGIAEVVVSPRTVPHPDREEIFTLGECDPLPMEVGSGVEGLQSRIVLYHGSFAALARLQEGFDWRREAWETLTHELRHHLEWRARAPDLEDFDWAVEHNFARQEGEQFDPTFFLSGELEPRRELPGRRRRLHRSDRALASSVGELRLAGTDLQRPDPGGGGASLLPRRGGRRRSA